MGRITRQVTIVNQLGLHARPAFKEILEGEKAAMS